MYRMIKMHFYRLTHTKAMWIIILLTAILMFFSAQPMGIEEEKAKVYLTENIVSGIQNGNVLMLMTIIIAVLVTAVPSTGYSKNIAGYLQNKYKDMLSYVLITAGLLLIMLIVSVGTITVGTYMYNEEVAIGDITKLVKFLIIQFYLYMAYGMFVICVGRLTQNNGATIATGILYILIVESLLYGLLEGIFGRKTMEYSIFQNIYTIRPESSLGMYMTAFIVGTIYIVLSFVLGNIKKRNF